MLLEFYLMMIHDWMKKNSLFDSWWVWRQDVSSMTLKSVLFYWGLWTIIAFRALSWESNVNPAFHRTYSML